MKKPCYFCTDHDAKKCPERVLQHLRHIAEQAGKEQYFNALHSVGVLVQDCMRELRVVLNRPRTFLPENPCCNASHAPSVASPAGSAGTAIAESAAPVTALGVGTATSDSARRALADETNWPAWLTREAASTLPEGTERVYHIGQVLRAYPGPFWCLSGRQAGVIPNPWEMTTWDEQMTIDDGGVVYHLPPAAKGEGACCHTGSVTRHPDPSGNNDVAYSCGTCGAELARGAWLGKITRPDAGRAEGVIGAAVQDHINRCAAPKPSPGEVAEVVTKQIVQAVEMGGKVDAVREIIETAIKIERNRP